jgi:hypothetical protein
MLSVQYGRQRALEWFDTHGTVGPDFLTALGWKNAAYMLAESGRWLEAATYLLALPESRTIECPDLLFVYGVINVALILPEWLRPYTLAMQIIERQVETFQGDQAAIHRRRALESFANASKFMKELGASERATAADIYRTWLLLTEPSTYQSGRDTVAAAMRQGVSAVEYAQLAYVFGIPFDPGPLERYLRVRELSGGLTPRETAAKLALYRQTRPSAEVAQFLEEERTALTPVLSPEGHVFLLARALVDAGQFDQAQRIITENRAALGEDCDGAGRLDSFRGE